MNSKLFELGKAHKLKGIKYMEHRKTPYPNQEDQESYFKGFHLVTNAKRLAHKFGKELRA